MLKIRLRRVGKKNQPSYRVVVVEHTAPVQGSYHELLGSYNPRVRSFIVKQDRVLHWLDHGAKPSERLAKLLTSAGITHKHIVLPDYDRKPKQAPKKAAQARAEAAAQAAAKPAAPVAKVEVASEEPTISTTEAEVAITEPIVKETPVSEETVIETPTEEIIASESADAEGGSTPEAEQPSVEEEK
ncbi:MAG: 30S ribosomal protein S16 [Patescibacteria group bacterium]